MAPVWRVAVKVLGQVMIEAPAEDYQEAQDKARDYVANLLGVAEYTLEVEARGIVRSSEIQVVHPTEADLHEL